MAATDGSVIIKVRFDTSSVQPGIDEIMAGCKRAAEAASDAGKSVGSALGTALTDVPTSGMTDAIVTGVEKAAAGGVSAIREASGEMETIMSGAGENVAEGFAQAVAEAMQTLSAEVDQMKEFGVVTDEAKAKLTRFIDLFRGIKEGSIAEGRGPGFIDYDFAEGGLEKLLELQKEMDMSLWERLKSKLSGVAKKLLGVSSASEKAGKSTKSMGSSLSENLKTMLKYGVGVKAASSLLSMFPAR